MGGFKCFKRATQPLTTSVIAEQVIVAKGLEDRKELHVSIQRPLTGTLRRLEKRGLVKDGGRARNGLPAPLADRANKTLTFVHKFGNLYLANYASSEFLALLMRHEHAATQWTLTS